MKTSSSSSLPNVSSNTMTSSWVVSCAIPSLMNFVSIDKKVEKKMFPSACSSNPEEVVTVDVSQAKTLLQSDHQYLDVRTEEEFRRGHCLAPKILNVPYMLKTPQGRVKNQDFLDQVSSLLNPTDEILVGCQSGARSLNATSELLAAGFKKVRNIGGGYLAWVDHSLPINKEQQSAN